MVRSSRCGRPIRKSRTERSGSISSRRRGLNASPTLHSDEDQDTMAEGVDEVYELFLDLDADEQQIDFPIVYCNAKAGVASLKYDPNKPIEERDLAPLLDLLLE